jgi:hypothetical protein
MVIVPIQHSQGHTHTLGRTPLDEGSALRRVFYLTTHNTNKNQVMSPAEFEPTIPASERPQTHALDRVATAVGCKQNTDVLVHKQSSGGFRNFTD